MQWRTLYRGYYINLDRSTARRAAITENLQYVGLLDAYERIPAIDGNAAAADHATPLDAGSLGLWLTHQRIFEASTRSDAHVHILEDDTILAKSSATSLPRLLNYADQTVPDWDLIYTHMLMPLRYGVYITVKKQWDVYKQDGKITLMNIKGIYRAHSTSFFVNKRSIEKYLDLISGGWTRGIAIDEFHRELINEGKLKALASVPFLASLSAECYESVIRGHLGLTRRVHYLYSRAFFADADHDQLLAEMRELVKGANRHPLADIYLGALGFSISDQFETF